MKKSAGIIAYKIDNGIKVLLCHFGGPYWENKDNGAWSFSKGEVSKEEKVFEAAQREFSEETGLTIKTPVNYLGTKKISRKKLAIMFYTKTDLDISNCKSNTFEIEYPKGSGVIGKFPEMDKYEWMDIDTARVKIVGSQLFFLNRLEEKVRKEELL